MARSFQEAAIAGIGATEFSKNSGRSELQLAAECSKAALDDAGIHPSEVDGMITFTIDNSDEVNLARCLGVKDLAFTTRIPGGGAAAAATLYQAMALVNAVRAAMQDVDPNLPITRIESMNAALADSIATERLIAALLAGFAVVALLLAAAGVYGVIAYTVAQRTTEIGVRVALGADPGAVLRLVAREGFAVTAAGMIAGTLAAAAASRALRTLLFDVSPADPLTYAAVLALFAAVACAAVAIPARRALRVDPLVALRAE